MYVYVQRFDVMFLEKKKNFWELTGAVAEEEDGWDGH